MSDDVNDQDFEAGLDAIAAELVAAMPGIEKEVRLKTYEKQRRRLVKILRKMQSGTLMGAAFSTGSAIMDAHDQQSWKVLCRIRGEKIYAEVRFWAMLYECDLNITHLRHTGELFPGNQALVQSEIFHGMMEANAKWAREDMGEAPPSPRGKMIPEPEDPAP
jgi:hypothetical protein